MRHLSVDVVQCACPQALVASVATCKHAGMGSCLCEGAGGDGHRMERQPQPGVSVA
jgi:hypothetical protein